MPQIMAEAFARGLLDKIMVEVLDVIDRDTQDEKSWGPRIDEETDNAQLEFVNDASQAYECTHKNYSKAEEMELIAKIVRDLRDIQIGDSRYVLSPSLLALEKQVKCAACNVDGVSPANPTSADIAETQRASQGQGDTRRITPAAIHESPAEPTEPQKTIQKEKESDTVGEATSVSAGLLHQLIEQLENKTAAACSKNDAPLDSTSKDRIAVWEEKEEQLIRTIEGNAREIATEALRSESIGRFRVVELKHNEELRCHSSQHVASASRDTGLEEIQIEKRESSSTLKRPRDDAAMEQILPADDAEKRKTLSEITRKKKRGFGDRLRKFLRTTFGHRKN
ncbi:uncharacterized protein [Linepithema humile]|uniref:uncharacterized protein n=1 Tax=Linepithema humile TaxID=83485 RepID=UPI0006230E0A|nr:PREDICTED: uncharacterized protein LOC105671635 [Linepithema humile]